MPPQSSDIMMHAIDVAEDGHAKEHGPLHVKTPNTTIPKTDEGFPRDKPTHRPLSPVTKILFLDGIRGAAVVCVVTQHSGYIHDLFMGVVGVDAFFVLFSFLLTMIFMKKSIKLIAEAASYPKWGYTLIDNFSKRFFRVYPLFALSSIALLVDAVRVQEPILPGEEAREASSFIPLRALNLCVYFTIAAE